MHKYSNFAGNVHPSDSFMLKFFLQWGHCHSLVVLACICTILWFESNYSSWCHRSSIFRGCTVPSRVHIPANEALPTVFWSAAGCSWKTTQLPTERLPTLATVWSQTITLAFLIAHQKCFIYPLMQDVFSPEYILFLNPPLSLSLHRDMYSDRSGSSSPDSEIAEFKLPSISQDGSNQ